MIDRNSMFLHVDIKMRCMYMTTSRINWVLQYVNGNADSFDLFDLMLYVHGKQLRSCWDGQLLNQPVPAQAYWRQFTSIKCPFFCQYLTNSSS